VVDMMKWIQANEHKPVSVAKKFMTASVNVLWSITCGQRLQQDDPEIQHLMERYLLLPLPINSI